MAGEPSKLEHIGRHDIGEREEVLPNRVRGSLGDVNAARFIANDWIAEVDRIRIEKS